jgi:hypothetical protein
VLHGTVICFKSSRRTPPHRFARPHLVQAKYLLAYAAYEWQFIRECLLEDEHALRKKPLGGHEKLRDRRPLIFFSR